MENFPSKPERPRNPADKVISNIFRNEGWSKFAENVEKTLSWSEKGGARPGTPLFIQNVAGKDQLSPTEYTALKRAIEKEIRMIKKRKAQKQAEKPKGIKMEEIRKSASLEDQRKTMIEDSQNSIEDELKRSGGIDPNEI